MFAMSKEGGMLVCPIDICLTPTPAGDIPIPYPNMGEAPMAEPGAETVLICGCPALNTASEIAMTEGDEPGASGGIMSGEIMGAGKFMEGSQKVRIEGVAAAHLTCPTTHNEHNGEGTVAEPSQEIVDIME